jgi:hypothetical protein
MASLGWRAFQILRLLPLIKDAGLPTTVTPLHEAGQGISSGSSLPYDILRAAAAFHFSLSTKRP